MSAVVGLVVRNLQTNGYNAVLVGTGPLKKKVADINNANCDCAIELHLNAAGGMGIGFETLHCAGSNNGKNLASHIHEKIAEELGSRDRGVREGWYRMDKPGVEDYPGDIDGDETPDYFLSATNCPAVITEFYFLDNAEERNRYAGNTLFYFSIAEQVTNGILSWLNS